MQRPNELGFYYGPYGGIGYVERDGASESADLFAWARLLIARLLTLI